MDGVTKEENQPLTCIYKSEEELKQLKVLAMVLQRNDLMRMGDVAIDVLKIEPQNLVAKMVYGLDVKKDVIIDGITFYSFHDFVMEQFLDEITLSNAKFETESYLIILRTLSAFVNLLAFSKDCSEALLNKVFACFTALNPDNDTRKSLYREAVTFFSDRTVLTALKRNADDTGYVRSEIYYTASDILKVRRSCLISLKRKISGDATLATEEKNRLLNQIVSTGLTIPPAPPAAPQEEPKKNKIAYIGLGILAVAVFVIIYLVCC